LRISVARAMRAAFSAFRTAARAAATAARASSRSASVSTKSFRVRLRLGFPKPRLPEEATSGALMATSAPSTFSNVIEGVSDPDEKPSGPKLRDELEVVAIATVGM
jgi:hypothetical protein